MKPSTFATAEAQEAHRYRNTIYSRGRRSARKGEGSNPFDPSSQEWAWWQQGFESVGTTIPNDPDDVTWRLEATRASAEYARRWHAELERIAA